MNDRRQNPRYTTDQELEAYDLHSARFLGRFVDISEDGFMLFCPQPIDVESVWQIRVLAANDPKLRSLLSFGAECLWIRPTDESNHCWVGFHIIDISPEDAQNLHALFSHLE